MKLCCNYLENGRRRLDGAGWLIPADAQSHWAGFSPARLVGPCAVEDWFGRTRTPHVCFPRFQAGSRRTGPWDRGLGIAVALVAGQAIARELGAERPAADDFGDVGYATTDIGIVVGDAG